MSQCNLVSMQALPTRSLEFPPTAGAKTGRPDSRCCHPALTKDLRARAHLARWTAAQNVRISRSEASGDDTLKQVEEEYPSAGRGGLPVKDVGRLLLHCADRPGLVAAVSAFLAGAGANIVSLDQHSTEQSGGTFMQRTIFNLPGLTAARDALERDFRDQVASQFDMDFRLTEAAKPKARRDHGVQGRPLPAGPVVA